MTIKTILSFKHIDFDLVNINWKTMKLKSQLKRNLKKKKIENFVFCYIIKIWKNFKNLISLYRKYIINEKHASLSISLFFMIDRYLMVLFLENNINISKASAIPAFTWQHYQNICFCQITTSFIPYFV